MGRSCPKNSNINETFQQAPWKAKIEGWVWLVVADISGSERLFLRSGNDVPVNLYRWMLLSVLIRKGKVPRHTFHRPRSQSWLRGSRSQLAAPSGTEFPRPALLSSLREAGMQLNWPSVSSAAQMGRPGPTNWLIRTATAIRSQRQGWGRGSLLPQGLGQGQWRPYEASGALQDGAPVCSLGPPLTHGPKAGESGGPPGEGLSLPLTSLSTGLPGPHWPLAESLPQWSLTDSYQWAGIAVVLTNSWAGQLTLVNSWLLLSGAYWGADQWLRKTCCLVTRSSVMRQSEGHLLRAAPILLC